MKYTNIKTNQEPKSREELLGAVVHQIMKDWKSEHDQCLVRTLFSDFSDQKLAEYLEGAI